MSGPTKLILIAAVAVAVAAAGVGLASRTTDPPVAVESERRAPSWSDSFESGDFSLWSWSGRGQEDLWGHVAVVPAAQAGVPPFDGGRVARFETTPEDIRNGRIHAKVFKAFSVGSGRAERPYPDQGGVYRAWYYLPDSYRVPRGTTVNAFQFKDNYLEADGGKRSDPLWWVNFGHAAYWAQRGGPVGLPDDAPVAYINSWGGDHWDDVRFAEVPLGRWFELRAHVVHGDRIDFYLDGRELGTARASQHPVNTFHGSSINLIFGIGNYSGGANGPLYVDAVSYTP